MLYSTPKPVPVLYILQCSTKSRTKNCELLTVNKFFFAKRYSTTLASIVIIFDSKNVTVMMLLIL